MTNEAAQALRNRGNSSVSVPQGWSTDVCAWAKSDRPTQAIVLDFTPYCRERSERLRSTDLTAERSELLEARKALEAVHRVLTQAAAR